MKPDKDVVGTVVYLPYFLERSGQIDVKYKLPCLTPLFGEPLEFLSYLLNLTLVFETPTKYQPQVFCLH